MENTKSSYKSKTIIWAVVILLSLIFKQCWVEVAEWELNTIAYAVIDVLWVIMVVYGRYKATKAIK